MSLFVKNRRNMSLCRELVLAPIFLTIMYVTSLHNFAGQRCVDLSGWINLCINGCHKGYLLNYLLDDGIPWPIGQMTPTLTTWWSSPLPSAQMSLAWERWGMGHFVSQTHLVLRIICNIYHFTCL